MMRGSVGRALVLAAQLALLCGGLGFADGLSPEELVAAALAEVTVVSVAQAREILDAGGALFLDVREPEEYQQGRIPRAANIPRGLLEFRIGQAVPEKSAQLVVYCRSGKRSALAAQTLLRMGYTNVVSLEGGWLAWEQASYPRQ